VTAGNLAASAAKAFVETGYYEWDWTTFGSSEYANAEKNGWLEPIDYSIVKASDKTPDTQFFEFGVGAESTSDIIAYRTDTFPDGGPQSWADYWDTEKFPGTRSMWKNPFPILEAALVANGVDAASLYPLDLDRAFRKADEIKDKITVWWESGTQSQDVIVSKNVVIGNMWNGRAGMLARDGQPIAINWNQGFYDPAFFVVPKGAPNKENAMRLIDFAAGPQALATFANLTYYGPSNLKSIELIDPKVRTLMNTAPENLAVQIRRDYSWWAENLEHINERFVSWLIS
jgi:putative spermidine/putrescine transport system substrate-binding protein